MQLNDVLSLMAMQLLLPPDDLIKFAKEDVIGGYSADPAQRKWPMGSLYSVEGQILYTLVRALKPQHVVEIGSLRGCSTAHLATALSINGGGRLTAIDTNEGARDLFPAHLEGVVTPVIGDGLTWLREQPDESIDFIFEDSSHATEMCAAVAELCKTKLTPGGILVMHDAAHDFAYLERGQKIPSPVGGDIRRGLDQAIANEYRVYLAEPSDCGVAIWQRKYVPLIKGMGYSQPQPIEALADTYDNTVVPEWVAPPAIDEPVLQAQEDETPAPPKKKPAKKPKKAAE